jgi:hypothetical protein
VISLAELDEKARRDFPIGQLVVILGHKIARPVAGYVRTKSHNGSPRSEPILVLRGTKFTWDCPVSCAQLPENVPQKRLHSRLPLLPRRFR